MRGEAGVQAAGWKLSTVQRTEVLIESGRETTDLAHLYKTQTPAPAGRTYNVDLRYAGYEARGWRLDKSWNWKTPAGHALSFGLGYSVLEGTRVRAGSARGSLASLGGGNYNYAVSTDDAYTRKTYPFQTEGIPEGRGESLNLALEWKTPQGIRLEVMANDLLAQMRWRDIPATAASANTGVTSTDANGFVVYAPVLSGRNARRDFTQKLPGRWGVGAEIPWRDYILIGSFSGLQRARFPLLGIAWQFRDGWRLQADYDLRFRTFGIRIAGRSAFIALRTSERNLDQARAYGVAAGLSWVFN